MGKQRNGPKGLELVFKPGGKHSKQMSETKWRETEALILAILKMGGVTGRVNVWLGEKQRGSEHNKDIKVLRIEGNSVVLQTQVSKDACFNPRVMCPGHLNPGDLQGRIESGIVRYFQKKVRKAASSQETSLGEKKGERDAKKKKVSVSKTFATDHLDFFLLCLQEEVDSSDDGILRRRFIQKVVSEDEVFKEGGIQTVTEGVVKYLLKHGWITRPEESTRGAYAFASKTLELLKAGKESHGTKTLDPFENLRRKYEDFQGMLKRTEEINEEIEELKKKVEGLQTEKAVLEGKIAEDKSFFSSMEEKMKS